MGPMCERDLKETGRDLRLDEIVGLIEHVKKSKDRMYERRKSIDGFGIIYGEGKVIELLTEVFDNYILGNCYSTIASIIDSLEIKFGDRILIENEKEELKQIPFGRLIEFLSKINILDEESRTSLHQINEIRNRHIHSKMENAENDALKIVNVLCRILESRLSMFKFYKFGIR